MSRLVTPHVTNRDEFNLWHGVSKNKSYSGYLTNTSCACQVAGISNSSNDKQKKIFLKQKWHVSIRDFKKQKKLIFWIVTRVSACNYTVSYMYLTVLEALQTILKVSEVGKYEFRFKLLTSS